MCVCGQRHVILHDLSHCGSNRGYASSDFGLFMDLSLFALCRIWLWIVLLGARSAASGDCLGSIRVLPDGSWVFNLRLARLCSLSLRGVYADVT